jgi:hypothetical protein
MGELVVLFPQSFDEKFSNVAVFDKRKRIEKLEFTGFANGHRQHWRKRTRSLSEFPDKTLIVRGRRGRKKFCWKVKKPQERND